METSNLFKQFSNYFDEGLLSKLVNVGQIQPLNHELMISAHMELYSLFQNKKTYKEKIKHFSEKIKRNNVEVIMNSMLVITKILTYANVENATYFFYRDGFISTYEGDEPNYEIKLDEFSKLLALRFIKEMISLGLYSYLIILNCLLSDTVIRIASFLANDPDSERGKYLFLSTSSIFQQIPDVPCSESTLHQSELELIGFSIHQLSLEILQFFGLHLRYLPFHQQLISDRPILTHNPLTNKFARAYDELQLGGVVFPEKKSYFLSNQLKIIMQTYSINSQKSVEVKQFYNEYFNQSIGLINEVIKKFASESKRNDDFIPVVEGILYETKFIENNSFSSTKRIYLELLSAILNSNDRHSKEYLNLFIHEELEKLKIYQIQPFKVIPVIINRSAIFIFILEIALKSCDIEIFLVIEKQLIWLIYCEIVMIIDKFINQRNTPSKILRSTSSSRFSTNNQSCNHGLKVLVFYFKQLLQFLQIMSSYLKLYLQQIDPELKITFEKINFLNDLLARTQVEDEIRINSQIFKEEHVEKRCEEIVLENLANNGQKLQTLTYLDKLSHLLSTTSLEMHEAVDIQLRHNALVSSNSESISISKAPPPKERIPTSKVINQIKKSTFNQISQSPFSVEIHLDSEEVSLDDLQTVYASEIKVKAISQSSYRIAKTHKHQSSNSPILKMTKSIIFDSEFPLPSEDERIQEIQGLVQDEEGELKLQINSNDGRLCSERERFSKFSEDGEISRHYNSEIPKTKLNSWRQMKLMFSSKLRKEFLKKRVLIVKNEYFEIGMITNLCQEISMDLRQQLIQHKKLQLKAKFYLTPMQDSTNISHQIQCPSWMVSQLLPELHPMSILAKEIQYLFQYNFSLSLTHQTSQIIDFSVQPHLVISLRMASIQNQFEGKFTLPIFLNKFMKEVSITQQQCRAQLIQIESDEVFQVSQKILKEPSEIQKYYNSALVIQTLSKKGKEIKKVYVACLSFLNKNLLIVFKEQKRLVRNQLEAKTEMQLKIINRSQWQEQEIYILKVTLRSIFSQ